MLGYFVWKITILRQKMIFFQILVGGGGASPWIRPCVVWILLHNQWSLFRRVVSQVKKFDHVYLPSGCNRTKAVNRREKFNHTLLWDEVPAMVEIVIFWFQIHITNGLNSLHRKWHTGNQYMVKSAENRMRSNLELLPVMNVKNDSKSQCILAH
jgi:hypothetical protein